MRDPKIQHSTTYLKKKKNSKIHRPAAAQAVSPLLACRGRAKRPLGPPRCRRSGLAAPTRNGCRPLGPPPSQLHLAVPARVNAAAPGCTCAHLRRSGLAESLQVSSGSPPLWPGCPCPCASLQPAAGHLAPGKLTSRGPPACSREERREKEREREEKREKR